MTASDPLSLPDWAAITHDPETELQQELRAMFEVDTQQYLQDYFDLVQQLNPQSWIADIQCIYRAIHTIKGGAVTVEADAMLHAGMVLEDLLSDLRFLDQAPDLSDKQLSQMLLEAGELLSSSIDIKGRGDAAIAQVNPAVQRIQALHQQIRLRYLPDWNEMKQVHQEFAEQGFDLVILALEMALNQLSPQDPLPPQCLQTAQQTLDQLTQIGHDLQFAPGWTALIAQCQMLLEQPNSLQWQQSWPQYFRVLKDCAREGGELSPILQAQLETLLASENVAKLSLNSLELDSPGGELPVLENLDLDGLSELNLEELATFTSGQLPSDLSNALQDTTDSEWLDGLSLETLMPEAIDLDQSVPSSVDHLLDNTADLLLDGIETDLMLTDLFEADLDCVANAEISSSDLQDGKGEAIAEFEPELVLEALEEDGLEPAIAPTVLIPDEVEQLPSAIAQSVDKTGSSVVNTEAIAETKRSVQISVPLERLDQSAQQVVETMLAARGVINISQKLQTQLTQITSLSQESAQFITRLRQLQDDYALLRTLSDDQDDSNVTLERYRQGYTTINRLLENILRMSELGQEIETVNQETSGRLDKLDRSLFRLKDGIETSRLVPFRNLSLRARAIVRDLSNRYGKPVELVVQGEQVELDASVLQQIEPALLHLLRNAYDHGIEPAEIRARSGKPAQGTIQLSLHRRGNLYRLMIQDDGGGIDLQAIAQTAKTKGFAINQIQTNADLLAVLCQPGFSSRSAVTEVSGRGVGMDVVAGQIASLNGRLSLETALGQGTTFIMEVPAPQLLVPCVLLEVGGHTLALPTDEILETVLISSVEVSPLAAENSLFTWTLQTHRGVGLGFDLVRYWRQAEATPDSTIRELVDTAIAIRPRSTGKSGSDLWFIADNLLGQEELLINPLPNPLVAPAGLMGVSLQPDGRLISVLDPIALTTALQSTPVSPAPSSVKTVTAPLQTSIKILVVDDAALMRRRLEGSLGTHGFTTFTCADGLEAWKWLQTNEYPDLMITDVEMPNMDGFTLIDRCRQAGFDLPILVVSSRLSEEWGKEARRLGASDYLNKGFSTPELISKVNQLLPASVPT